MIVLNLHEKLLSDNLGCIVKYGDKKGINLGLNFITEKRLMGDDVLLETPEVKGVKIYFPDARKIYVHEIELTKIIKYQKDNKSVNDILVLFLSYFFNFDYIGTNYSVGMEFVQPIIDRFIQSGMIDASVKYV